MHRFCLVLLICAASGAAQTVEGNVINSRTGSGISSVKVAIVQGDKAIYSGTTDTQGHFRIEGVADGDYSAKFSLANYLPEYWDGSKSPPRFQMTAGNDVRLEVQMAALPRLTGRVVDERGKPVAVGIEIVGSGWFLVFPNRTDGRFSVEAPLPGLYTLAAVPRAGPKLTEPAAEKGSQRAWTRTFYPGVASNDAAAKIAVLPGMDLAEIEVKLLAVRAHAVRGVLLGPDNKPLADVRVSLTDMDVQPRFFSKSSDDGSFEFPSVVDGQWRISGTTEINDVRVKGGERIDVAGRDLEGVKLQLNAPFAVHGKVLEQTSDGKLVPMVSPPGVSMRRREEFGKVSPTVEDDGSATFKDVYAGTYTIDPGSPPGYYLSTVKMGEQPVSSQELEFSSGAVPLTLIYRKDGGTLRGTAEKCKSGEVLLLPQDPDSQRPEKVYAAHCDSNDQYIIQMVPPGDYYALALTGNADGMPTPAQVIKVELGLARFPSPYRRPFDSSILNRATTVTVKAGETSSVDLKAFTRPLY